MTTTQVEQKARELLSKWNNHRSHLNPDQVFTELSTIIAKADALDWLESQTDWDNLYDFVLDLPPKQPFNILSAIKNAIDNQEK